VKSESLPIPVEGIRPWPPSRQGEWAVVPPAYLRRVPYERGNSVEALSLHRRLAAEGVAVVEARPNDPLGLVDAGEGVAAVGFGNGGATETTDSTATL